MTYPLEYAGPLRHERVGVGYALLVFFNLTALVATGMLFATEISSNSYARLYAVIIGVPLIAAEILLCLAPAIVYFIRQRRQLSPTPLWLLLALPMISIAGSVLGICLAMTLPHASAC